MHVPIRRALGLLLIVGAALWLSADSLAFIEGPRTSGANPTELGGCTCHGAVPTASTVIAFTGLPATYEAGKAYPLVISSTASLQRAPNPTAVGGFHLQASAGSFAAAGSTQAGWVQTGSDPPFIEHTPTGAKDNAADANKVQKWEVTWNAPTSGDVTFNLYVNRVNGDGSSDAGDKWNEKPVTVKGPGGGGKSPGLGVLVGIVAVAGALAWAARRRF